MPLNPNQNLFEAKEEKVEEEAPVEEEAKEEAPVPKKTLAQKIGMKK